MMAMPIGAGFPGEYTLVPILENFTLKASPWDTLVFLFWQLSTDILLDFVLLTLTLCFSRSVTIDFGISRLLTLTPKVSLVKVLDIFVVLEKTFRERITQ